MARDRRLTGQNEWTPLSCACTIEYRFDPLLAGTRRHHFTRFLRRCEHHRGWGPDIALVDVVRENYTLASVARALPACVPWLCAPAADGGMVPARDFVMLYRIVGPIGARQVRVDLPLEELTEDEWARLAEHVSAGFVVDAEQLAPAGPHRNLPVDSRFMGDEHDGNRPSLSVVWKAAPDGDPWDIRRLLAVNNQHAPTGNRTQRRAAR